MIIGPTERYMIILYMFNLGHLTTDEWRFEIFGVTLLKIFNKKYS